MNTMKNRLKKCCQLTQVGNPAIVASSPGDGHDEDHEADREQPKEVEPLAVPDPDAGSDAVDLRNGARKRRWVDDVLAPRQLRSETPNSLRRDARRRRARYFLPTI